MDYKGFLDQISDELSITRYSHGHMLSDYDVTADMNTESFSSKKLFNERASNEDILKIFEHITE
jgi:hypothetical protein